MVPVCTYQPEAASTLLPFPSLKITLEHTTNITLFYFVLFFKQMCVLIFYIMCVHAGALGDRGRQTLLELKSQTSVSTLTSVPGIEPWFPARAVCDLDQSILIPTSLYDLDQSIFIPIAMCDLDHSTHSPTALSFPFTVSAILTVLVSFIS